jgi:plastocyanin
MRLMLLSVAGVILLAAGSPSPRHRSHVIEMRGMVYRPAELAVAAGDTVLWINRDPVPHTATAAGENGWDTGEIASGDTGRLVVTAKTTSDYTCQLHPAMRAKLSLR